MSKSKELFGEFKSVFFGKGIGLLGSILPLLIFLITYPLLGQNSALWGSLIVAGIFGVIQLIKQERWIYSLGGVGSVLLAALFVKLSGSETAFFLPGLITGGVMVGLSVLSIAINRPLVAWSSYITRRWPLGWYWHPNVLPAYNQATMIWAAAFFIRISLEYWFYTQENVGALGAVRVFLGWPYTILLLIVSYIYGQWRLGQLEGPSVAEFNARSNPPWEGQKRGF